MTEIFTPSITKPQSTPVSEPQSGFPAVEGPSSEVLRNILNYSRNLEILPSATVDHIEVLRS